MRDTVIIKIISKIYLSMVTLFSFIILSCIFTFFILQNGLYLDKLEISNVSLNKISLRMDKRVHILIDKIEITPTHTKSKNKFTLKELNNYLKIISRLKSFIGSVTIETIKAPNIQSSLHYKLKDGGLLSLKYQNQLDANITFQIEENDYYISIHSLNAKTFKSKINGTIILDTKHIKLYSKLNASINNDANLTLFSVANSKNVRYGLKAKNPIYNVKTILNLIPFDKDIKYWANDAIDVKSLQLNALYGTLDLNHIKESYKKLYIDASLYALNYKYNPKLEAIHSKKTILKFQKGKLSIYPLQASTYKTSLQTSWLEIDFTQKNPILHLYLHLNARLNRDILHLLASYNIKLPFYQKSGKVKTDLQLHIDLGTIETNVVGDFRLHNATVEYLGSNFTIQNAHIHLKNSTLTIDTLRAKYKDIIDTNLTMHYNVAKSVGEIILHPNTIQFQGLQLNSKKSALAIYCTLSPKKAKITVTPSQWFYKTYKLKLKGFSMPFNPQEKRLYIPATPLQVAGVAFAYIGGDIDFKTLAMGFDIDLLKFHSHGFTLAQTDAYFHIDYKRRVKIVANDTIYMRLNGSEYKIKNFKLLGDTKSITLQKTFLTIGNSLKSRVDAKYNFKNRYTNIVLHNFTLQTPKIAQPLYENRKIALQASMKKDAIIVKSPQLNAQFISNKDGWKLSLSSLKNLAKNSQLLQLLQLSNGTTSISKKSKDDTIKFTSKLTYPYALLMNKEKKIDKYRIDGELNRQNKLTLKINKNIEVTTENAIHIHAKKVTFNLHEILRLIKEIKKIKVKKGTKERALQIYFSATDSSIYLEKKRYAISDTMFMQYANNIITAQLRYKKGEAGFKMSSGKFYLYGKNFNDTFMEQLSAFSKFKGGKLDFSMQGKLNDYTGIFFLSKTNMVDYILLNNILAFVNTIPSLVTFSLPNYSTEGLYVKNGYMEFSAKNDIFHIHDLALNSDELKITGKGDADLKNNKINLLMNLKTDLASDVSKIPLVGYIIFDGKSLSTTLKITGKMSDPKIETQIAKEIVVAPLNIIKRTITLPYKLIKKAVDSIKK